MHREDGFSLLEVLVATAIMLTVTAGVFTLMDPAQGAFQTQPEVADMQQRLRIGQDTLFKDLVMAGGGAYEGSMTGSLMYRFAPILPYRRGSVNQDPPGTFTTDRITLLYVPVTVAQTTLKSHGPDLRSTEIAVYPQDGCPMKGPDKDPLCGFNIGMVVMMYDDEGHFDTFTITNVQDSIHIQHNGDTLSSTDYATDGSTKIVQVSSFNYYLNTTTHQLMFYDGSLNADVPLVDNVVGLSFDYYADPQPPVLKKPYTDPVGPWTTYGPRPYTVATPPYGLGENCTFFNDGSPTPAPRLPPLGDPGTGLVKLTPAQLTDGPWCPDDQNPDRWDADLLRIRKIGVTLRVQSAVAALRGPASVLFTVGGTSRGGNRFVPDQEIRFQVTPRNMNLGR